METDIVVETATRMFLELADPQSVLNARGQEWREILWRSIEETGLNLALTPEALGGADVGMESALGILRAAGNTALAVPLAETILATWCLGQAGIVPPQGRIAFGPTRFPDTILVRDDATLHGRARQLAFADECSHLVVVAQGSATPQACLLRMADIALTGSRSLAGDFLGTADLTGQRPIAMAPLPEGFTLHTPVIIGAAVRAIQIAGALETMLRMTADYVVQRKAFGRTLSRFQVVQHQIAQMAGETAIALSSALSAAETLHRVAAKGQGFEDPETLLEVAAAKIRTSLAAQRVAQIAHQLHGAIGVTQEHSLHRFSLRALAWRDDFGSEIEWAARLGRSVAEHGEAGLWPLLSSR